MINERRCHIPRQIVAGTGGFCGAQVGMICRLEPRKTMIDGMMIFVVAVGGTGLICYVLAVQSKYRRRNHGSSPDSFGSNNADIFGIGDGSHFGGGGGHHSTSDHSNSSGDSSSSGDVGGGGDSGGGGDGGGSSSSSD
jgi:hypothetical protein